MIIGKSFVWLHFPKCAGTTVTRTLSENFGSDPDIVFDDTQHGPPLWHETIDQREQRQQVSLEGKDILVNFRRLPYYVVSKIKHTESMNPEIQHVREQYVTGEFFEADWFESSPDYLLDHYNAENVAHWIRTEHLHEDFIAVFSRYLELQNADLASLSDHLNKNTYDREIGNWYQREEMQELYNHNPLWRDLELRLYGNLLHEEIY